MFCTYSMIKNYFELQMQCVYWEYERVDFEEYIVTAISLNGLLSFFKNFIFSY